MKMFLWTQFLLIVLLISQVYCCYWSTENLRQVCNSLAAVDAEGNDTWSNLFVSNYRPYPFALQANSFKRTPNLQKLAATNVNEIELDSFAGLTKLVELSIFDSFIDEVPMEVFANLPIRTIQLFNDSIKNIMPGFFENLPGVRFVDLRKNIITEIKTGVFNNTPIYKLYLDGNLIESIEDDAFINMDNLYHLGLARNRITSFESLRILGTSNTLQSLWLNQNNLTQITTKVLESVPYLQKVFLEINQIDDVEDQAFEKVPHIDFIDLSNNQLTELRPSVFSESGATKLYYLFLHNNRLTFIRQELFTRTPKLTYFTHGGNPLQCSCLENIRSWTENMTKICDDLYDNGQRPVCVNPVLNQTECLYDVNLTKDLYDTYLEALTDYPIFNLKCDTTKGVDEAKLINVL